MPTATGHTTAIRASRVIGTEVKDNGGNVIGKVEDLILDKTDNAIMFAVVGFGGVLGMGEKFHPVPWSTLDYDPEFNAYVVPFSKEQLEAAPADTIKELTKNDGSGIRDQALRLLQGRAVLELSRQRGHKMGGFGRPFYCAAVAEPSGSRRRRMILASLEHLRCRRG